MVYGLSNGHVIDDVTSRTVSHITYTVLEGT